MTLAAVWAPENVTGVIMNDQGWEVSPTASNQGPTTSSVYGYVGSPTRYSWALNQSESMLPPAPFQPVGGKGCWSAPWRMPTGGAVGVQMLVHQGISHSHATYIYVSTPTTMGLVVGNAFQGNSQEMDLTIWRYYTLKSDMSTEDNWTGEMLIDGVSEVSGAATDTRPAILTDYFIVLGPGSNAGAGDLTLRNLMGGLSHWTDLGDAAEVPMRYTWVDVNEDISETGGSAWTPGGTGPPGSNNAAVSGPLDTATHTQEAVPASGERVTMGIKNGGSDDLEDALGTDPPAIAGISVWAYSTGQAINARAVLSDGTDEDLGGSTAISATDTTHAHVCAPTRADGGNTPWAGTDQPELAYEIV